MDREGCVEVPLAQRGGGGGGDGSVLGLAELRHDRRRVRGRSWVRRHDDGDGGHAAGDVLGDEGCGGPESCDMGGTVTTNASGIATHPTFHYLTLASFILKIPKNIKNLQVESQGLAARMIEARDVASDNRRALLRLICCYVNDIG